MWTVTGWCGGKGDWFSVDWLNYWSTSLFRLKYTTRVTQGSNPKDWNRPLHVWLFLDFHWSNTSLADTASSTAIPGIKIRKISYTEHYENVVGNLDSQSTELEGKRTFLHAAGLTKGFEHSRLPSVSRFCPINNISKLCKHLRLQNQTSPITFRKGSE